MAKFTVEIDEKWLAWSEARIGHEGYSSNADLVIGAFEALEREEYEDVAMYASYGAGSIDDPEAIARGKARIVELIEEGVNSGPPVPWDLQTFLREERSRDPRRAAA